MILSAPGKVDMMLAAIILGEHGDSPFEDHLNEEIIMDKYEENMEKTW